MDDALKECERKLARLQVENEDLRKSALEFGDLAERLSRVLREGRPKKEVAAGPINEAGESPGPPLRSE